MHIASDYLCKITIGGHRGRQPWLSMSINLLKICISKIVLNVMFIVEVFENKSCTLLAKKLCDTSFLSQHLDLIHFHFQIDRVMSFIF